MRILVTGAAGSLGRKFIEKLVIDETVVVYATDIKTNPFKKIDCLANKDNLVYRKFDLTKPEFIDWVNDIKPEKVVHLASILQVSATVTREMAYQVDVVATQKLLEACIALSVQKFIITTSGASYGYYPENINEITEERATNGNQDYFYSAHKAEVEKIMADYRVNHPELTQIVFRPGTILGPDFEGPIVNFFEQKILTSVWRYPGPFNFIWSDDVVDYLIEGVNSDITGQFNIAGDGTLTIRQIAKILDKVYLPLPGLLIQAALAIAKPLGLTQYGPEQVKFIKYRPVLANKKIKAVFTHQPKYNSLQALAAFLDYQLESK